ncbi:MULTISPECIES: sensor histidine kinase [Burkholderia]|uniref:sensor histidine kinase n=1 Tax=Burkholderia TaxID=32008 RepID=UPI0007577E55|nr:MULTISPECIES: PAS domain-containing sensor histidine kinase [Burkholderia]KVH04374.1 histidine kinase [Burkholderia anthina]KVH06794.1 histidine kinase [Burkholderia anthina]KVM96108.1 histidine kinase [Burkholderia anthina]KVN63920.1 histidine kinase [Burkholderia anthina]KVX33359.1 histidine kinase [Burkholderia anthina]
MNESDTQPHSLPGGQPRKPSEPRPAPSGLPAEGCADGAADRRLSDDEARRVRGTLRGLPCGVIVLDRAGAVVHANARALEMLAMALPAGVDFSVALSERFEMTDVPRLRDLEAGREVRVDDSTFWIQAGPAGACGGAGAGESVIAVTDVTPFARSLDERAMSLRFLLHDLRSPLNSISALTQLDASDPEAFERCGGMQQITSLAQYVLSLGEQFIFSSVTEHLQARDFKRFDLRATLRQIISQLEVTAVYCGVALHLWLPDSAPLWVSGMRNFVARAVQNVIDNAVRASPRGEAVTVSIRQADGFAEVVVDDRAGGLPGLVEGDRLADFEKLGKRTATGFGLGLKLAVQIVGMHGGALYAELNGQGGTMFVLRLPCLNPVAAKPPATSLVDADRALRAARGE